MRSGLAVLTALLVASAGVQAAPPNIIFMLVDDLGYGDIGPFGSVTNRTPALDRMAREGMRLTSFYAAPVCTPSRAQVLTGCYAKRVSLPNVIFPACPTGINPEEHTVAELLKAQGYATMCIGKWHVGDQPEFLPQKHGFDEYFGIPYSNDMGGDGKLDGRGRIRPPLPLLTDSGVAETLDAAGQDEVTRRYTEAAVRFITRNKENPFFLYFPHTAVHTPLHPGPNFKGRSANGTYGDWVEEVDWSVGQVLDLLRQLKIEEKTLFIFSSDNGPWLTQGRNGGVAGPLRGGKGGTFEGGVRVPTIARWPGRVPAGTSCDAVAGNIDLLPTFVALAGGTVPADRKIDGRDISPLLLGQTNASPREAHYYFAGNQLQAVRAGPWKLAITAQQEHMSKGEGKDEPDGQRLYNLERDLGEKTNVAAQNPEVVKHLQQLVAVIEKDLGLKDEGPGVRACGRVEHPRGLYRPGQEPRAEVSAPAVAGGWKVGDSRGGAEAPQVAGRALTIAATVMAEKPNGVIVAHGGKSIGYALYLRDGHPVFTVRQETRPVSITAPAALSGQVRLEARLARDGAMSLGVDGQTVATGRAPGSLPMQPQENFCVGFDDKVPVGEYEKAVRFQGVLSDLQVRTE